MQITPAEVAETLAMVSKQNLDIRTITLGINLRGCVNADVDKLASKWEKGTSDPSTHNLIALAELYGVDAATLIKSVERGDSRAAGASSES